MTRMEESLPSREPATTSTSTTRIVTIFHYIKAIYVVFLASFCFQIACLQAYIIEYIFVKEHISLIDILGSGVDVNLTTTSKQVTQLNGAAILERVKALIASFSIGSLLQLLAILYVLDLLIVKGRMQSLILPLIMLLLVSYTLLQWLTLRHVWPKQALIGLVALFPSYFKADKFDYQILLGVQLCILTIALLLSLFWIHRCYFTPSLAPTKRFGINYCRLFHALIKCFLITGLLQLVHLVMMLTFNYANPIRYIIPALVVGLFILLWGIMLHATFQFIFHPSKFSSLYWRLTLLFFLCLQCFLVMQLFPPFSTPGVVCPSSNSGNDLLSAECDQFIGHREFLLYTAMVNVILSITCFYANWRSFGAQQLVVAAVTAPSFQLFRWNFNSTSQQGISGKLRPQHRPTISGEVVGDEVICFANTDSISTISLFDAEKLRHLSLVNSNGNNNSSAEFDKMRIPDPPAMLPPLRTPERLSFSEHSLFGHNSNWQKKEAGEAQIERLNRLSDEISETTIEYLYHQVREKHTSQQSSFPTRNDSTMVSLNGDAFQDDEEKEEVVAEVFTSSASSSSKENVLEHPPPHLVSLGYLEDGRPVFTIPPPASP